MDYLAPMVLLELLLLSDVWLQLAVTLTVLSSGVLCDTSSAIAHFLYREERES